MIDPIADPRWQAFLKRCPRSTIFHSPEWLMALHEAYGFRFDAVTEMVDGDVTQGIACCRVGDRFISLPFSDYAPPLIEDNEAGRSILELLMLQAGTSIEARGDSPLDLASAGFKPGPRFLLHRVRLDRPLANIEEDYHASARRAVRKAEREGVTVRRSTSAADMRRFYAMVVTTRRKQQLLPQPRRFYEAIQRNLIERGNGWLLLAEHGGHVIAGDLLLKHGKTLTYKFNASNPAFLELRPNNLLVHNAIRVAHELGCDVFDFGRCDMDGDGLRRFKLMWGSEEEEVSCFYFPGPPRPRRQLPFLKHFVRYAPDWALIRASGLLYRRFA